MHQQDHLLSCQLRPAFPPAWKECGAVRLQANIICQMERMVWEEIWTPATYFSLSQSEAFPPLSLECSDIAHEHDVILPIKGKCMCALEALRSDIWLLALGLCLGDPVLCS